MDEPKNLIELYELNTKALADVGARFDKFKEEQKAQFELFKTEYNRPPSVVETKDKVTPERKAITEYLRGGWEAVTDRKALYRSDFQSGGIFAGPEWVREMIRNVVDMSAMRQLVRVRQTSNYSVRVPKYTGTGPTITKKDEKSTITETPITTPFGFEELAMHEKYASVDVSTQDVEDADFDIEGFIREEIALQFAVQEGKDILVGTGIGEPFGILDTSSAVGSVETTASNLIASDDIMDVYFELKPAYLQNANWAMNRAIVEVIAKLKNATSGDYMWQPGLQTGIDAPLMGKKIYEAPDMPGGLVDGDLAVLFGDFRQAYWLVDRKQVEVVRDPLTKADQGLIHYVARRRQGGKVVKPEALKILKIKA